MAHTFLFEPGVWNGSGTLWRSDGEPLRAEGRTEIVHKPECWVLSGTLKILGSPPTEFVHAYLIEPPRSPNESLKWTFESATFGKLSGRYAVIGSALLSVYGCEASGYYGADHFGQIDPRTYRSCGMLLLKDKLMYSWEMRLQRA